MRNTWIFLNKNNYGDTLHEYSKAKSKQNLYGIRDLEFRAVSYRGDV